MTLKKGSSCFLLFELFDQYHRKSLNHLPINALLNQPHNDNHFVCKLAGKGNEGQKFKANNQLGTSHNKSSSLFPILTQFFQ